MTVQWKAFLSLSLLWIVGAVPAAVAEIKTWECPERIARISSFASNRITVYTQDNKIRWFMATPSGLIEQRSMQLSPRETLTDIWENEAFSVLQIVRSGDFLFEPKRAHFFFRTLDAETGKVVDERDRPDQIHVQNVFFSNSKLSHDYILNWWQLSKGDRAWHMHAVRPTLKWMNDKVAIDERNVGRNTGEIYRVTEFDSGATYRFPFGKLAKLVAANSVEGKWRFYVHEGDQMLLHSKGARQPVAFPVKEYRRSDGFPGGCVVETENEILILPWERDGNQRPILSRDGAEWTYGGNEQFGFAAKIGTKTIHQFAWQPAR